MNGNLMERKTVLFTRLLCKYEYKRKRTNSDYLFILILLLHFLCSWTLTQFSISTSLAFTFQDWPLISVLVYSLKVFFLFLYFFLVILIWWFFTGKVTEIFGHWSNFFHILLCPLKQLPPPPLLPLLLLLWNTMSSLVFAVMTPARILQTISILFWNERVLSPSGMMMRNLSKESIFLHSSWNQ